MAHLSLSFLGGFEVTLDAEPITTFGADKARALLAYLAIEAARPHRREVLAAMFWPDATRRRAAHSLSQALLMLRKALGENQSADPDAFLSTTQQDVQFNPYSDYSLDVVRFRELVDRSDRHHHEDVAECEACHRWLGQAVDLYRGDLLAGLFVSDSFDFEEWRLIQQEGMRRQALEILGRLAAFSERQGDFVKVKQYAQRQIALEPWREEAHLQLMRALAESGQISAALKQYETFQKIMADELGLSPSEETVRYYKQIRARARTPRTSEQPVSDKVFWLPGQGERRQVTTLVCGRCISEDREDFQAEILACERYCEPIFSRFGGRRSPRQGSTCLVYFGYPKAYEDAARRAVYSGLSMAAALDGDCAARIGIHTGRMLVGEGHGPRWQDRDLSGVALEVARACQSRAQPGHVLVTEDTRRLVQDAFLMEELNSPLSGVVDDAIPLYRVVGQRNLESRLDWLAQTQRLTSFVGRTVELDRLEACYEDVLQGKGRVVLVRGEPGIGKSRLIWELKKHVKIPWLASRCQPEDQNTAFHPLIRLMEQLLGFNSGDSLDTRKEKLLGMLTWYGLNQPMVVHLLPILLGLPTDSPAPQVLTKDQLEQMRQVGLILLEKRTAEQPLVLVIDDLQWSDPSTAEWISLSLDFIANIPCLLLLVARPVFNPLWLSRPDLPPGLFQLNLGPLSPGEVEEMVAGLMDDHRNEESVRCYIVDHTDGIPLFAEELTKTLLEHPLQRGEIISTGEIQTKIPTTLQDSLIARLDRLGPAKETAQWAAALGREFFLPVLQACVPYDRSRLQNDLARLVEAELITPLEAASHDMDIYFPPDSKKVSTPKAERLLRYVFKHILIQEAADLSMLNRSRQDYHRRIGEVLLEKFPQLAEIRPEILAHHFISAAMPAKAIDFWLLAGERATARGTTLEARAYFERAIESIQPGDHEHLWRALLGRERVFGLRAEYVLQKQDIDALLKLAEVLDETRRAQAWLRQVRFSLTNNDYPTVLYAAEKARLKAISAGKLDLEIQALSQKLHALISIGGLAAAESVTKEILTVLPDVLEEEARATALSDIALYFHNIGDLSRAALLLNYARKAARLAGNKRREITIDVNMGFTYIQLGLYPQARDILEEGKDLAEAIGELGLRINCLENLSYMHWGMGDLEQAFALIERTLREQRSIDYSPFHHAYCFVYLGFFLEGSGDLTSAVANLDEARSVFVRLGVDTDALEPQAVEARCLLKLGREDEARQLATEVWSILDERGSRGISFPSRVYLCIADVVGPIECPGITASEVIEIGYQDLLQRAGNISDPQWRRSYLENDRENCTLIQRWKQLHNG